MDKSAFESDRMAEKIEHIERKALRPRTQQVRPLTCKAQFKQLEYHGSADQQLLELKAKMGLLKGGGEQAKQLGKGMDDGVHDAEVLEDDEAK
ncbi:MAG: hypothetical protein R2882_08760 [Gemmatimonadales bacterium]